MKEHRWPIVVALGSVLINAAAIPALWFAVSDFRSAGPVNDMSPDRAAWSADSRFAAAFFLSIVLAGILFFLARRASGTRKYRLALPLLLALVTLVNLTWTSLKARQYNIKVMNTDVKSRYDDKMMVVDEIRILDGATGDTEKRIVLPEREP